MDVSPPATKGYATLIVLGVRRRSLRPPLRRYPPRYRPPHLLVPLPLARISIRTRYRTTATVEMDVSPTALKGNVTPTVLAVLPLMPTPHLLLHHRLPDLPPLLLTLTRQRRLPRPASTRLSYVDNPCRALSVPWAGLCSSSRLPFVNRPRLTVPSVMRKAISEWPARTSRLKSHGILGMVRPSPIVLIASCTISPIPCELSYRFMVNEADATAGTSLVFQDFEWPIANSFRKDLALLPLPQLVGHHIPDSRGQGLY